MNKLEKFHYHRANCAILDAVCVKCKEDCPEAGRKKAKAEAVTLKQKAKKWTGEWPKKCELCPVDLSQRDYFVDGKTKQGSWVLMCPICHSIYGIGFGLGKGQLYSSKTLEKLKAEKEA